MSPKMAGVILVLVLFPDMEAGAQPGLSIIKQFAYDEQVYLTGSVALVADSTLLVAANGGLMCTWPEAWLVPVRDDDYLISYQYRSSHENVLRSSFNQGEYKGYIVLQSPSFSGVMQDTIAVIDSCVCAIENAHGMVIVHGFQGDSYRLWELTPEGFADVFSLRHAPTDLQIIDGTTLMASFYNKIITMSREAGPALFFAAPEDSHIHGFLMTPAKRFYLALDDGIYNVSGGQLIPALTGIRGRMEWQDGRIIVLDQESSSITVLRE